MLITHFNSTTGGLQFQTNIYVTASQTA